MNYKPEQEISDKAVRNRTLIGLGCFLLFIAAALIAWKTLEKAPKENGALKPLRKGLNFNERFFTAVFNENKLSKSYPKTAAVPRPRVNGNYGLEDEVDTANWVLHVVRKPGDTLLVTMNDIKALPKTEVIFDFKCIEGWSQVTHWAGVKFSDFVKKYNLTEQAKLSYTGLVTPDDKYYVGIDRKSMMHPQTILCYEMNDAPLPINQGYPLRLIIPVKYGVKHLKRIGFINFSDSKPKDFWHEQGYDYYCGF